MSHHIDIQQMPPHVLKLKKELQIVLIRNVNPSQGLCNGTQLIVKHVGRFIIQAEIITGSNIGTTVLIPRITFTIHLSKWPFKMICRQFPIRRCHSKIINNNQGV